jgi:hypothetical protein
VFTPVTASGTRWFTLPATYHLLTAAGLFLFSLLGFGLISKGNFVHLNYFVPLADAFLHGRLYVAEAPRWLNELVPFQGRHYVVYPPMPAVLLMPFVAIWGTGMNQGLISVVIGALNVALCYMVLQRFGLSWLRATSFALLFAFGTVFWFSVQVGSSWHFAQVCAVMFLWLAILETLSGKRPWLIGLLLGCAAMSRLPTLMAFPFFVAFFLQESRREPEAPGRLILNDAAEPTPLWQGARSRAFDLRGFARKNLEFDLGLAVVFSAYLAYNHARFGSPFTTGYYMIPGLLAEHQYQHGFFSLQSIPRNMYAMLLKTPRFIEEFPYLKPYRLGGISLLLTTPFFLWAAKARGWDWLTVGCWGAIALTLCPILLHADPGGEQFGYRYAIDFYPFLLLLAIRGMGHRFSVRQGLAIAIALAINALGIYTAMSGAWA